MIEIIVVIAAEDVEIVSNHDFSYLYFRDLIVRLVQSANKLNIVVWTYLPDLLCEDCPKPVYANSRVSWRQNLIT